jgi:hypothetical protein
VWFAASSSHKIARPKAEEINEAPISQETRAKAKEIIARGLKAAMDAPELAPEEVWQEFDTVRQRMRKAAK